MALLGRAGGADGLHAQSRHRDPTLHRVASSMERLTHAAGLPLRGRACGLWGYLEVVVLVRAWLLHPSAQPGGGWRACQTCHM